MTDTPWIRRLLPATITAALLTLAPSAWALPIHYCDGSNPCYEVCECPENVGACDPGTAPPCCLGSEPCPALAVAGSVVGGSGGIFSGVPAAPADETFDESVVIGSVHPGTAVLSVYREGRVIDQQIVALPGADRVVQVPLRKLGGDFFRLHVDVQREDVGRGRQPNFTVQPSVFHVVEARRSAEGVAPRQVIRLAPDALVLERRGR